VTGWRAVHAVMESATVDWPQASPKWPARFVVAAVSACIRLNLVQKWLDHAQLPPQRSAPDTVGAEEKGYSPQNLG
jgi:integrase/recombinase XerD